MCLRGILLIRNAHVEFAESAEFFGMNLMISEDQKHLRRQSAGKFSLLLKRVTQTNLNFLSLFLSKQQHGEAPEMNFVVI